jgi:hypothetical protein
VASIGKAFILNRQSVTTNTNGDIGNLSWGNAEHLALDINVTLSQGTSPTLQILVDRLGADGTNYFNIYDSTALAPGSYPKSASIGPGCTFPQEIGSSGRVRWVIGGSSNPAVQFGLSLQGE